MPLLRIIALLLIIPATCWGQSYATLEVKETAKSFLKEAVGEYAFRYFKYDTDTYYEYKKPSGKSEWIELNKKKKTKGQFVKCNVRFILDHPNYQYEYINKTVNIRLDKDLKLTDKIRIDKFPEFILKNQPSPWISDEEIDIFIDDLKLKKAVKPIARYLQFNHETRQHYWEVINTTKQEKCYSDVELIELDPLTGAIIEYRETKLIKQHCY